MIIEIPDERTIIIDEGSKNTSGIHMLKPDPRGKYSRKIADDVRIWLRENAPETRLISGPLCASFVFGNDRDYVLFKMFWL